MSRLGGDQGLDGADQIQQRIQIARRDAEALKDKIKRKKDELADTTRKWSHCHYSFETASLPALHLMKVVC